MTLDEEQCWARLVVARHGVLGTVHPRRGVDAVPVVFALISASVGRDGRAIVIPIDRVKPKRTTRLQRLVNLEHDERCVLLVDHYAEDWSRLWWVRVHAQATAGDLTDDVQERFASLFPAYQEPGSIESLLTLSATKITGWSFGDEPEDR
jgi:PPOX class probable F420-dependent enzyme